MQYRILKKERQIELRGFMRSIPASLRNAEFILPCTMSGDGVDYQIPDADTLQKSIRYISEKQFLLYIYSIAKAAEQIENESQGLLQFVLDSQYIFCESEMLRGILAPTESGETVDYKSFFWNLLFAAEFETKDIPIVKELLGFIRAARTIRPQDLILFIEMGAAGKEISALYSKKFTVSQPQKEEVVRQDETEPQLQTGNDFSSFLSDFVQPMEYVENAEEDALYEESDESPPNGEPDHFLNEEEDHAPIEDDLLQERDPFGFSSDVIKEDSAAPSSPESISAAAEDGNSVPRQVERKDPLLKADERLDEPLDEPLDELFQPLQIAQTDSENRSAAGDSKQKQQKPKRVPSVSTEIPNKSMTQVQHFTVPVESRVPRPMQAVEQQYFLISSEGRSIPLLNNPFKIGRASQGVDLTVQDVFVSRLHAKIVRKQNGAYFMDLHPKNPSYLNERPVEPDQPYLLQNDDRIRFGKTVYYFRCVTMKR